MKFTWDEKKRLQVEKEHRVDFNKLTNVFEDAFSLDLIDDKYSTFDRLRFTIVGKTVEYGLVHLVYTMPNDDEIHLITARRAEKWYVKQYEKNVRKT